MGLLKTGVKYGALFGAAKVIMDGYSKSHNNDASKGEFITGPLQSDYSHEPWCNGSCGDRCRSRNSQPQQQQQQPYHQQQQNQSQTRQLQAPPQYQQGSWGQNVYVHEPGCKGNCNLRCCDGVAPRQWEHDASPAYQQY